MVSDFFEELFEFFFGFVPIIIVAIVLIFSLKKKNQNKTVKKAYSAGPSKTVSSDGHVIKPENDPTCAKYGHVHEETKHRYIVHDEPVEGYVNLNGRIISLKEAAKY